MSIHLPRQDTLPPKSPSEDDSSSSESDDDDQTYDDWVSDSESKRPTRSLFDKDLVLPSSAEALEHDKQKHGFELLSFSAEIGESSQCVMNQLTYVLFSSSSRFSSESQVD